jgi:hypothetical protein
VRPETKGASILEQAKSQPPSANLFEREGNPELKEGIND